MSISRTARPRRTLTGVLTATLVGGCSSCLLPGPPPPTATDTATATIRSSVIFINGDGMAAAQREAGPARQAGFDGELAMDTLGATGLQTTDPPRPGGHITDSAAAASAWATGQKTYNGAISVDVDGNPLPTIGAEAKAAGKATGLVTTAQVTDASPAAFFSNTADRGLRTRSPGSTWRSPSRTSSWAAARTGGCRPGNPGAFPDAPRRGPAARRAGAPRAT